MKRRFDIVCCAVSMPYAYATFAVYIHIYTHAETRREKYIYGPMKVCAFIYARNKWWDMYSNAHVLCVLVRPYECTNVRIYTCFFLDSI